MAKVGRPTKYKQSMLTEALLYLEQWETLGDTVPSLSGLSDFIGVPIRTLTSWKSGEVEGVSDEFLLTLDKIDTRQHRIALNKGLKGDFNAAITKLVLHNHGYSEKQEIESNNTHSHRIEDLDNLSDEQLADIATGRR